MDIDIIKKAGLTESQAKAYIALIEHTDVSASELAEYISETRTNTYAIVDKLLKYGLISKKEDVKYGAKYNSNHPSALEALAESRRKALARNEKSVKDNIGQMIDYYYQHSERPGIRFYQGANQVLNIFDDILREHKDMQIIRSPNASLTKATNDPESRIDFIQKRVSLGIKCEAITPTPSKDPDKDKLQLYVRHFLPENLYDAPVEITIYGNKVALVSFGSEIMGTIIESPQIAEAFKQIFHVMTLTSK